MEENLSSNTGKKCKECGQESSVMVNGLCLDCYDIVEEELKQDDSDFQEEDKDELEILQELYYDKFNKENSKEEMIIHGKAMKDPDYEKISRERTISMISNRNKPRVSFKGKKR